MAQTQWAQVEFMADGEGYGQHEDDDDGFPLSSHPQCISRNEIARGAVSPTIALTIVASE